MTDEHFETAEERGKETLRGMAVAFLVGFVAGLAIATGCFLLKGYWTG